MIYKTEKKNMAKISEINIFNENPGFGALRFMNATAIEFIALVNI